MFFNHFTTCKAIKSLRRKLLIRVRESEKKALLRRKKRKEKDLRRLCSLFTFRLLFSQRFGLQLLEYFGRSALPLSSGVYRSE